MQHTKKVVIALLLSALAYADINKDYENVLHGKTPLSTTDAEEIYAQFLKEFKHSKRSIPSDKFQSNEINRRSIFENKLRNIIEHNQNSSYNFKKGINAYTDLTTEEFFTYYHIVGDDQECSATNRYNFTSEFGEIANDLPAHWDWRSYNVVTPVKDQGNCGSCWTFSTVGCVESHYMMKYGQFKNLSEQQLVDCAGAFDNAGCNGGLPSHAFEYISAAGGLTTEDVYPYMGVDQNCTVTSDKFVVGVRGGAVNISESEDDLRLALFLNGPISVAFNVLDDFMDYASGVYHSDNCPNGPQDVNHAVLAVGYGSENGMDYWIVKNSWSASWGDQGYFKIQRGVNMCGIVNCNSYPQEVYDLKSEFFHIPM